MLPHLHMRWLPYTFWLSIACIVAVALLPGLANAQFAGGDDDLLDRPISEVRLIGLKEVPAGLVRNNIRADVGQPYDPVVLRDDVGRLYRLGRFSSVTAEAELVVDGPEQGTVVVIYTFIEQTIIREVQVVGNTLISDQELLGVVRLMRGSPRDDYLVQNAVRSIEALYRARGHYLSTVVVDESELERSGILIFRIIEGPRIRIRDVQFEGNNAFNDGLLHRQIKTRTAILALRRGELDQERLIEDVAALVRYYRDRGYLEVRVDHHIDISPDHREAIVTFYISEGPLYTLRSVRAANMEDGGPLRVFDPQQVAALLDIRPGDVYSQDKLRQSVDAVMEAYGRLGYHPVQVEAIELHVPEQAQVDLLLEIREGEPTRVGHVEIQGNLWTRDRVIRRHVRLQPGRPLDVTEIDRTRRRIYDTRLFSDVRLTIQPPEEDDPYIRDVLVEVRERNTGSVNFGVAVGSDAGVFGDFSIRQDNFDIADWPASFGDLARGRAFRGAGQRFSMAFRPGNELFQYAVNFTDPHLLDSEYSLNIGGSYQQRYFRRYDEERLTGIVGLGRQLGDVWSANLHLRAEHVELRKIDAFAPTEVFRDAGPDVITAVGMNLTRNTITTITRPGRGTRFNISYDRFGAMGGDYNFNRLGADYTLFLTLHEDFLGRKSTLRLNSEVGYIFGGRAPTYERYYRGGRSFRGFRFREVSPKGIRADNGELGDDPIGGTWMFFAGAQYEFPLFGDMVTGVFFVDSGTVTDDVGFDDYRVSVGTGLRLYIPQFGPVPIAFDFGFPIAKQEGDETQVLSFSAELPF